MLIDCLGCSEMIMSNAVQQLALKTPGKEAEAIETFAFALRQLPTIIADNAGFDSADLVAKLRALHSEGQSTQGIDITTGDVSSSGLVVLLLTLLQLGCMKALGITESFKVKSQVVISAAEAAEMILRVDTVMRAAPRQRGGDHH